MKMIPNSITTRVARTALLSQKHSPRTLFVAGMIGMGGTIVLACRATLRVETVLDEHEKRVAGLIITTEHDQKLVARERFGLALDIGKLYAPAVVCGVLSASALASSHNILNRRNAAMVAAYGTLEKAYSEYRERVAAAYGREREEEIYRDVQVCEIEDPESGKKSKKKVANGGSPYKQLFDENNKNWEPTPEYNFLFLKLQQQYANDRLQAKGHVFLNEVYDDLGLERTKAGAVVGWVKDGVDNFIDFGIFEDEQSERVLDFMVGREKAIWLDFNVDGLIYDKI